MSSSDFKQPHELTATPTLHETFTTDDEEAGRIANHSTVSSTGGRKGNMGWVIAGTTAILFIIALAVGLTTRNGGSSAAGAANLEETRTTTTDFVPQEEIGDASLLAVPDVTDDGAATASSSSPTRAPSSAPTTDAPTTAAPTSSPMTPGPTALPSASPTNSPSMGPTAFPTINPTVAPTEAPTNEPTESPTPSPSASPTRQPTSAPTNEPTNNPTSKPTTKPTKEPTSLPTKLPTHKPIDLSNWSTVNWDGSTPAPSLEPTRKATPEPTNQPTMKPTPQPSNASSKKPPNGPTSSPTHSGPFFFGDEFYTIEDLSLEVSRGLSVRVIARAGQPVPFANGGESDLVYHVNSDAAGIVLENPDDPLQSGYAYIANSEIGDEEGVGGVYAIYFDKDGNAMAYKELLKGTSRNCGGGHTPWNTWISCEEDAKANGQCWQIDPYENKAQATMLGGAQGGEYESVACDGRNAESPVFFVTEDLEDGALRRFKAAGWGWDALHSEGETSFLEMLDDSTFQWTTDEDAARASAKKFHPNTEGIQFHEGKLYFMAKEKQTMFVLDLETMTYVSEQTGKKFYGEGSFGDQPDQNMFGPTRKYIYFTEDGGESPGVYARYGEDGTYFTLFQGIPKGAYDDDETVGIALSPDHRRLYAGIQEYGIIFEITRDDGLPFE